MPSQQQGVRQITVTQDLRLAHYPLDRTDSLPYYRADCAPRPTYFLPKSFVRFHQSFPVHKIRGESLLKVGTHTHTIPFVRLWFLITCIRRFFCATSSHNDKLKALKKDVSELKDHLAEFMRLLMPTSGSITAPVQGTTQAAERQGTTLASNKEPDYPSLPA